MTSIAAPLRISIAMTTFDASRFLDAQLASLLAQDRQPFEMVICDDGSTDMTLDSLREFARTAPFPVTVRQNVERLGYRANFMACAALCTGELISFCDQDDVWETNKLARVEACFEDDSVLLVAHGALLIDSNDAVIGELPPAPARLFEKDPWALIYGFTQTFRATLLDYSSDWSKSKSHFIPNERMGHDRWILFIAAAIGQVIILPDRLVRYRQHGGNAYGASSQRASQRRTRVSFKRLVQEAPRLALQHDAAQHRVVLLTKLAALPRFHQRDGRSAMLEAYRGLEQRLRLRVELYRSNRLSVRMAAFIRLVAIGSYTNRDRWYFPLRALVKDAAMLLPLVRERSE